MPRVLSHILCALLVLGCLSLAPLPVQGQGPGDCKVNQVDGACQNEARACKINGKAGVCTSTKKETGFDCNCVVKKGGGSYTSLAVFLALLVPWMGFRGSRWVRRAGS